MAYEPEKREAEIVQPDNPQTPWRVPRGYPVVLGDGRAYFIPSVSPTGPTSGLMESADAAQEAATKWGKGELSVSGYLQAVAAYARALVAVQYSDALVQRIDDEGGFTPAEMETAIAASLGQEPPYKVVVKKN